MSSKVCTLLQLQHTTYVLGYDCGAYLHVCHEINVLQKSGKRLLRIDTVGAEFTCIKEITTLLALYLPALSVHLLKLGCIVQNIIGAYWIARTGVSNGEPLGQCRSDGSWYVLLNIFFEKQ